MGEISELGCRCDDAQAGWLDDSHPPGDRDTVSLLAYLFTAQVEVFGGNGVRAPIGAPADCTRVLYPGGYRAQKLFGTGLRRIVWKPSPIYI